MSDPVMPQTSTFTVKKSRGTALLLVLFFGPLGLLYSSVIGGILMIVIAFVLGLFTFGIGAFLTWPVCILWVLFFPGKTRGTITNG